MVSQADSIAAMKRYYARLETRLGFRLLFNNSSHHGYYEEGAKSAFSLSEGSRRMEDIVVSKLNVQPGAVVLDVGCGAGPTAINLAKRGILVEGIDIVPQQIHNAKRAVNAAGVQDLVNLTLGDYHLLQYNDNTFDAIICMESLGQSYDSIACLTGLLRVLKPGGKIVIADFETAKLIDMKVKIAHVVLDTRSRAAGHWPELDTYEKWLAQIGFENIQDNDCTENIMPLGRFFQSLATVPVATFIKPLGLGAHFPNASAAYILYSDDARGAWKYKILSAQKPMPTAEGNLLAAAVSKDPFANPEL